MIRRHSLSAVCMHWFNAFCWIALLFTGFALLSNPAMQPVGMWWPISGPACSARTGCSSSTC